MRREGENFDIHNSSMNTTTPNTRSMLNFVLYFSDSPVLDDSGKLVLVHTPHEKGLVEPPSLDGTISSEELSDRPKKIHQMSLIVRVEYA
jgi:hypothetical protein